MFNIDAISDLSARIEKLSGIIDEFEKKFIYTVNDLTNRMTRIETANTDISNGLQNVFNEFSKIKYIIEIQERPDIEDIKKEIKNQVLNDIIKRFQ